MSQAQDVVPRFDQKTSWKLAHKLGALAAGLLPFLVYVYYLCPTIAAGDTGELITCAKILGIPHPPGYPLFTLIGRIFSYLPIHSVAWRVNLSSAVFCSLACLFVYLSLFRLTANLWASLTGALGLALSRFFWHYAEVAEVFPLHLFLTALLTYFLILMQTTAGENQQDRYPQTVKYFWAASFFFGLALTNHHTIFLLAP
ncbi:MAG: DUF2723 domain-containing protein, partial [candidate division KSB1 bacterium]|nr:DUF2723 domain-containing protein [candidate division KSB1 bacterium]